MSEIWSHGLPDLRNIELRWNLRANKGSESETRSVLSERENTFSGVCHGGEEMSTVRKLNSKNRETERTT